jgi:hypothetical protein
MCSLPHFHLQKSREGSARFRAASSAGWSQIFLNFPLPQHLKVVPGLRPEPLSFNPPVVPVQFPSRQKAHPQVSHLTFKPDWLLFPHAGQGMATLQLEI